MDYIKYIETMETKRFKLENATNFNPFLKGNIMTSKECIGYFCYWDESLTIGKGC